MADLPARPDLKQLRHQATDLLRAARDGDASALERMRAVSDRLVLASAQLGLARKYGFASWSKLRREVERREILNNRDLASLTALPAQEPELASAKREHWCDHPKGAEPLGYAAMLRFDYGRLGLPRELPRTGAIANALLEAGAPVDGDPDGRDLNGV